MRQIVWADSALQDFDEAIFYIAQDEPTAAHLVADRIEAAVFGLGELPTGRAGRVTGTYEKSVPAHPT